MSDTIDEIRRLSGEAFDRAKPGAARLPMLRRLSELLEESEAATEITFGYTEEDEEQITIDPDPYKPFRLAQGYRPASCCSSRARRRSTGTASSSVSATS